MPALATLLPVVLAAFLASLVEATEAFTVLLAVGIARGWRPALMGALGALVVLALLVLVFGPLLELVPIELLQFVIGALLVLFGLRWLRKAILRASGHLPERDERVAFAHETAAMTRQGKAPDAMRQATLTAFGAVLLEGLEIVFIVIAAGAGRGTLPYAAAGAAIAVLLVLIIGLAVSRPLSRLPENALKLVVGLLLTVFGVFWTGEGLGIDWPGGDLSLLGIFIVFAALTGWAIYWLRPTRRAQLRVVK